MPFGMHVCKLDAGDNVACSIFACFALKFYLRTSDQACVLIGQAPASSLQMPASVLALCAALSVQVSN